MSNSALANYVNRITPNYSYREYYIGAIVIHSAGMSGDIYDLAEMIASGSTAYHYGIDEHGTVGLFVDEMYAVNATNDSEINGAAVQIVVMEDSGSKVSLQEGSRTESLYNLIEDICRRNYILKLDSNSFFQYGGPHVSISEINSRLTSARTSSQTEALKAQSSIAVGAIKPLMAIIEPEATNVNYNALKDMGVVGALMYAGHLFDSNHNVTKPYKSRTLNKQMVDVYNTQTLFGLRALTRARSLQEAKQEIYWLYFVVAKYPPKLGVWLETDLRVDEHTAEQIVELYYEYFVRWGLIDKSGLYCTAKQARLIGWENFADRMTLWLNEPRGDWNYLDQLLTPSFFKFNY